jgi:hypothetical protein
LITHFLGKHEVAAYSRDFAIRLARFGEQFPTQWFALGKSGWKMAEAILQQLPYSLAEKVGLGYAQYMRADDSISMRTPLDDVEFGAAPVLVIDSAVHSGRSMTRLIEALRAAGAERTMSYGLVLKSGSMIIPTFFGVVTDEKDRTYFELENLPNNRLHDKKTLTGTLRELTSVDADLPIGEVGPPFEAVSVGDLLYDKETRASKIFGYQEADKLIGFISFRKNGNVLFIDAVGTVLGQRDKGIMSVMMRWAETFARSKRCAAIELWGYEGAVDRYLHFGYVFTDDKWRNLGHGQRYKVMRKTILYNIQIVNDEEIFRAY